MVRQKVSLITCSRAWETYHDSRYGSCSGYPQSGKAGVVVATDPPGEYRVDALEGPSATAVGLLLSRTGTADIAERMWSYALSGHDSRL